jgi:hypothetical protein
MDAADAAEFFMLPQMLARRGAEEAVKTRRREGESAGAR